MAAMLRLFGCLVLLVCFIKMTEKAKEYDDPASGEYKELVHDFRTFITAFFIANFHSTPGRSRLILKPKDKSCDNRCNETRNVDDFCHCDRLCPLFRDCCHDYWPSCHVTTKPFNISTQEEWDCVNTKFRLAKSNLSIGNIAYMMINRCPATNILTNHSARNCIRPDSDRTNLTERLPVIGEDGKTYRNEYCARCHGITNITRWGLMVACLDPRAHRNNLTYDSSYLRENCTWYLSPGNKSSTLPSPCVLSTLCESLVSTAENSKYNDLINKCKAYSQYIGVGEVVYKNFHCASCNGKDAKKFQMPPLNVIKTPTLSLFFDYKSLSKTSDGKQAVDGEHAEDTKPEGSSDDVIQGYLTFIGLSLSITCLLAVVMTYIRFPTLRTVPGLVLLALSLSLLAYQALLLASPYMTSGTPGCKAMAVALHLMIISSFAWMSVMSYDVSKTFSGKGKSSGRTSSRSGFRRYVIFATTISISIVATTFILGETNAVDVGYGESSSCWIGERLALILFFYVPVGIMLVFNAVSLIWTIFSIRNVTKLTKGVQKSVTSDTRGQNVKIYSKLSTVMGVTWFLGFGVAHNTIVAYIYIIVNSLQGVFIFVTFVLNKRTMNMWRNTASARSDRNSTTTTRQTRLSKSPKATESYASTNQLTGASAENHRQQETGFTNLQESSFKP